MKQIYLPVFAAAVTLSSGVAQQTEQRAPRTLRDASKSEVEDVVKHRLRKRRAARPADAGKVAVEQPIKDALGEEARANRRVAPGRVRWHADFAAAKAAAKKTGRPVLHFQLLGRLDEEFC